MMGTKPVPAFGARLPAPLCENFSKPIQSRVSERWISGVAREKTRSHSQRGGTTVVAVDCSDLAICNGQAAFGSHSIRWVHDDFCRLSKAARNSTLWSSTDFCTA